MTEKKPRPITQRDVDLLQGAHLISPERARHLSKQAKHEARLAAAPFSWWAETCSTCWIIGLVVLGVTMAIRGEIPDAGPSFWISLVAAFFGITGVVLQAVSLIRREPKA